MSGYRTVLHLRKLPVVFRVHSNILNPFDVTNLKIELKLGKGYRELIVYIIMHNSSLNKNNFPKK